MPGATRTALGNEGARQGVPGGVVLAALADDEPTLAWLADYMRNAASPGAVNALSMMNRAIDVRSALPAIHVPTLVMARDGDLEYGVEETKWIADQIRGARFVSFPGDEHLFVMGRQEDLLDEIERFVATVRDDEADLDRVLATVMFTDMVGSTEKAAELGDKGWRDLVERHHGVVRAMLGRFRGKEVDTAGDGFFATFDGPARGVRCAQAISEAVRDSGSRFAPACTRVRSRRSPGRSAASPSTSARGSRRSRRPPRCSSPTPSRGSCPAPACGSRTRASTS